MSKLFYMVGIPGSGKSCKAEKIAEKEKCVIHSSDKIREELGDITDQSKNEEVFKILHKRIKEDLKVGKNVIFDSTGLSRKRRISFIQELKNIPCEKICILMAVPYKTCLFNNFSRERQVPTPVMKKMLKRFEIPIYQEGWDRIEIVWNTESQTFDILDKMTDLCKFNQNNVHHSLSLGEHMWKAFFYAAEKQYSEIVRIAALLHDIGKEKTGSRISSKGVLGTETHYYNHENVGSYLSIFYLHDAGWSDDEILYISNLILMHMKPLNVWKNSSKSYEKDKQRYGEEIIYDIQGLSELDILAK